ncbi:MAG: CHASE2 domain-containing protein [Oscillatoria sp. SIO1A7]|nr:CHASE2 domain-containing protein [Oscillatoria sp. SIO1A7]
MITQPEKGKKNLWATVKKNIAEKRNLFLSSLGVSGCVLLLRFGGLLQSWEWGALDQLFRLRSLETPDNRILVVAIDEEDVSNIGKWPINDKVMADLLRKLDAKKPRVIGLDIYRNLAIEPGNAELMELFRTIPNLIGIETLADPNSSAVPPPPILDEKKRVGFNNVIIDADGKARRNLLYWRTSYDRKLHKSFALKLALLYLKAEKITPKVLPENRQYVRLGKSILRPFDSYDGGYIRADSRAYQVLANFRQNQESFTKVSMRDVLEERIEEDLVRDRIVLIGSTARSVKDFFETPYSGKLFQSPEMIAGVELHANFVSQLVSAAMEGRSPLLRVWSEPVEWLWIFIWSGLGFYLSWRSHSPSRSALGILFLEISLIAICYIAFFIDLWLPLVPSSLALIGTAVTIFIYRAHRQEELKRSKEFLHGIIDNIPDPIFVKDRNHCWIVVNDAYAQFIGYPVENLLNKSVADFKPKYPAEIFGCREDDLVFETGLAREHEEEFKDSRGRIHYIATKRSLHKDAAGNLFLVGAIRDLTERKKMEEQLRSTAAELARYNQQLQNSEVRLRYEAYHDYLTGLPNRKLFLERLAQAIEWAGINNQSLALMFVDLDGFKQINDNQGHEMGDLLLKAVAKRLLGCLRGTDTVSRLGGDEFTVILPGISEVKNVERVAQKIVSTITQSFPISGKDIWITASIGVSLYPIDGKDTDTLIKNADTAMYRAKEAGKNQYKFS